MMSKGQLVLVVGPSGAGKDTLISAAKARFAGDPRFVFPKRLVTRTADRTLEDHDTISREEFDRLRANGECTLCWEAHGLGYIVPQSARDAVAAGRVVIANTSRKIVAEAVEHLPSVAVVVVTARPEVRAKRLAARGRETLADITARLTREGAPLPAGIAAVTIDNSGDLAEAVENFCQILGTAAEPAD